MNAWLIWVIAAAVLLVVETFTLTARLGTTGWDAISHTSEHA